LPGLCRDFGARPVGEFEAFLSGVDSALFAEACRTGGSKPRADAYFALNHKPPDGVLEMYARIVGRLGIEG
jgi:hypothetical protein